MDWSGIQQLFITEAKAMSYIEIMAVSFSLIYVVLAARENIWCWLAAIISVTLYVYICAKAKLWGDAGLQVFYFIMAIYGWYEWKFGGKKGEERKIGKWPLKYHLLNIAASAILTFVLGHFLEKFGSPYPYLDAFTTIFALVATLMVVQKILENWIYWIVIDVASIFLYGSKPVYEGHPLYLTAFLFLVYTIIATIGYFSWLKLYKTQDA